MRPAPGSPLPSYEFRVLLEARRRRLLESREGALSAGRDRPIGEIELALARIQDGNYGICLRCSGDIGRARLKSDPTAEVCIDCYGEP